MQSNRDIGAFAVLESLSLILIFMSIAIFKVGCGQNGKDTEPPTAQKLTHIYQNQEPFKDWIRERHQNIVLVHPSEHPHKDKYEDISRIFSSLSRQTCAFFKIEPPDSIVIYFYTGIGHGYSVTQREAPFSDGHVIHFWFPSFYGPPVVKHLLPKWSKRETRHKFLKNGIIALLDGSGQNYHEVTLNRVDSGTHIPLRKLSEDTTINVDRERIQSAEAASLVDYLVYAYDIDKLKALYISEGTFPVEVEEIFNTPLIKLEEKWIAFVKTFANLKSTNATDSSAKN